MTDIVNSMEKALKKNGVYRIVDKGEKYIINTSVMSLLIKEADVSFDKNYLLKIIKKYFL